MFEIYEHRRVERRLTRLPLDILKRYEKWKDVVSISGPTGLRAVKGFHDDALRGKWRGHRSSRLGQQYRLIYRVVGQRYEVLVVDVTAHDYSRR